MNNLKSGQRGQAAVATNGTSRKVAFSASSAKEVGYRLSHGAQALSEADQRHLAVCEESYDITHQMLSLYAMHPDSLYVI